MTRAAPASVFITGASSGIGAALARHYLVQGARVAALGRREAPLHELSEAFPDCVSAYVADVRAAAALQSAAADFMARQGLPDVVIANAGISVGTLTEHAEDLDAFRQVMETNVLGMVATFQPFIESMREAARTSGRTFTLVGIASVAGFRGLPGAGAYSASKAAAIAYLESLRVELHGSGIHVVTLCPGYIRTPMTAVNPYPMPFILDADDAARRMARAIARNSRRAVLPWQMALVGYLMRRLPGAVFDRLFARAGRKPRRLI